MYTHTQCKYAPWAPFKKFPGGKSYRQGHNAADTSLKPWRKNLKLQFRGGRYPPCPRVTAPLRSTKNGFMPKELCQF